MPHGWTSVVLACVSLLALGSAACKKGPTQTGPDTSDAAGASVTLRNQLRPPHALAAIRLAVDHEIRYLNNSPVDHPPLKELARLEPGRYQLFVEVQVKASQDAEPARLRRVHAVTVAGSGAAAIVVRLQGSPAALTVQGSAVGQQVAFSPPSCSQLNGDLSACEGRNPAGHAVCVVRALRSQAKKKMNPGWMGCANHQANRLRIARQLHGKDEAELFKRSRQLTELALRCVSEYYLCDP